MSLWALFSAWGDKEGKVESWDQDQLRGDDNLGNMHTTEAAEWALEEMDDDRDNAVIVSDSGKIEKWIMNSPKGERRKWW